MASGHKSLQKIVILGHSGVGKTSLLDRYVSRRFTQNYKTTIGADFSTKDVEVDGNLVTLQIWDTAGQERFHSLGKAFFRGADACMLVYDVSDSASWSHVETWRSEFIRFAEVKDPESFPFVVVGNKVDLDASLHMVPEATVRSWCTEKGRIQHFLVSAKTGSNVDEAFMALVKLAAKRATDDEGLDAIPAGIQLHDTPAAASSGSGCPCT